jgi:hypothetical protein
MKTRTSTQEQAITLATFSITSTNNKELNDALSKMMEIIDKKYIETNVQYDTNMKCILDDDQYLSELSELDMVNQVITLYNDVFGVSPYNEYKRFIEVKSDKVIGKERYITFELKEFAYYDHTTILI